MHDAKNTEYKKKIACKCKGKYKKILQNVSIFHFKYSEMAYILAKILWNGASLNNLFAGCRSLQNPNGLFLLFVIVLGFQPTFCLAHSFMTTDLGDRIEKIIDKNC